MLTERNFDAYLLVRNAIDARAQQGELTEWERSHTINIMYASLQWLEAELEEKAHV